VSYTNHSDDGHAVVTFHFSMQHNQGLTLGMHCLLVLQQCVLERASHVPENIGFSVLS
jgi:hypothetical protein